MTTNQNFDFQDKELYQKICGIGDVRLKEVEKQFGIKIIPRGISLIFQGDEDRAGNAFTFFTQVQKEILSRPDSDFMDTIDLDGLIQKMYPPMDMNNNSNNTYTDSEGNHWTPKNKILVTYKNKPIFPRTENQEKFVDSLKNNFISFGLGPAGTGKTFLSIASACRMMQAGEVDRLILTRPAVEAGESLGFLPGDLIQKVNPYLRPIYDALHECIGFEKTTELISVGKIEIAPIAFMRGRTLSNSFIILDEAQNCTLPQLKMFLTRFGKNSRMSISGDITQIDLEYGRSGLERTTQILKGAKGIEFIFFNENDITRHPIVTTIVKRFEGKGL
ncbi:PhoH family protein [Leptospira sp. GIMC2001]|uniref:PhoH family protein n=1 Tax=Leptospira sp. GIMC2001 TaxID=1513297 RepID=UPI002349C91C|nr:PhoH family protein [Leptospira sp. GIMC2001]WCL51369.1 PhoH family protein [Leptospira sp. GIMC2001]